MAVTASETSVPRRVPWLLTPVAVACLAAGLAAIGCRRSFTLAEVEGVLHTRQGWPARIPFWHTDPSGSVYLVFLKGWSHVGSAEWIVRLPSIVTVGLTAAALYGLGSRLLNRRSGLAAGVLLATSAYTLEMGRTAGSLSLAVLAATVATWLFVVALESGRTRLWAGYAVVAPVSVYVHASCALVLVAHAAALAFVDRAATRRTTLVATIAAALAAPAAVQVLAGRRHLVDALGQPSLGDAGSALNDASGRNLALIGLAAAGVAGIVFRASSKVEPWRAALVISWACVPLPALLTLSIARPSLDPRYLAVSTPALALLAGDALARLFRREAAAVIAMVTLAVAAVRVTQLERTTREDWRAAAAYALSARGEHDRIVVSPARALSAFSYYAGRDRGSLAPAGATAFLIVRGKPGPVTLRAARRAAHTPAYALRDERRFGDVLGVQRWERTGLVFPPT